MHTASGEHAHPHTHRPLVYIMYHVNVVTSLICIRYIILRVRSALCECSVLRYSNSPALFDHAPCSCFWRRTSTNYWSASWSVHVNWPHSRCSAPLACSSPAAASCSSEWGSSAYRHSAAGTSPGRVAREAWGNLDLHFWFPIHLAHNAHGICDGLWMMDKKNVVCAIC